MVVSIGFRVSDYSATTAAGPVRTGESGNGAIPLRSLRKLRRMRPLRRVAADRRGAALIELALALPVLMVFLFGIISGGSWLAMSHVVQESANEGARAALAGITPAERVTLGTGAALQTLSRSYGIRSTDVSVRIDDDGRLLTVRVAYDGSANPLLKLPIMPAATTMIQRQASVVLAGF
ncbi:pilus assembly protein [Sphingomonas sp. ABOLH]|nr:pilus assembly protein [Sphingomonas sp. ABOLH]